MFSKAQKMEIAQKIEELLLSFDHPEMPKERPAFRIRVEGKESWSWADIEPNWKFDNIEPGVNPWNERVTTVYKKETPDEEKNKRRKS